MILSTIPLLNPVRFNDLAETLLLSLIHSAPTAAPENLVSVAITPSSITIQWDTVPCIHQNGEITGHVIRFSKVGGQQMEEKGGVMRKFEITGLEPATEYEIMVAAVTIDVGRFTDTKLIVNTTGYCMLQ